MISNFNNDGKIDFANILCHQPLNVIILTIFNFVIRNRTLTNQLHLFQMLNILYI